LNRGIIKMSQKNYTEALLDFDEAVKINPQNKFHYLKRGQLKLKMGLAIEACHDFAMYKKYGGTLKKKYTCN